MGRGTGRRKIIKRKERGGKGREKSLRLVSEMTVRKD